MVNIPAEFSIARLDAGRLLDLETLHYAVYGRKPAPGFFQKKYDTSFTGITFMGYIAYNRENIPVSYYGVLPLFLEIQGKIVLAAQSGDTMTHPGYRNKGLFVYLANLTYELCSQHDIKLVYGFPNQNSTHGLINKLSWKMEGRLLRYTIPVKPISLMQLIRKWPAVYKKILRNVLAKYLLPGNGFPGQAGYDGVHRSEAYLQYKKYSPSFVLKILDAKIWVRLRDDLSIGDMDCPEENFAEVMQCLQHITARLGLKEINFQLSPGTKLNALFASIYKAVGSFPVCFKILDETVNTEELKFTFADIDIF